MKAVGQLLMLSVLALLVVENGGSPLRPGDVITVHVPHRGTKDFVVRDMGWGWMLESRDGLVWNMHALGRHRWKKAK
jgi:hypothetical protein